jgi:pimeloyl-ACP methyl ester carboxylesterase
MTVLALLLAVAVAVVVLPPLRARVKALPVLAAAVDVALPRPLAPEVQRHEVELAGVPGHLYTTGRPAPPLVFVPGATPAGLRDRRVARAATAIAQARRTVFVPDLALYERRFDEVDLDRIPRAARALVDHPDSRGRLSLLGFSYGGAYALLAAGDPRLAGTLAQVAVFGAYFDLAGVVQAAATGVSLVDGERIPWNAHPDAEMLLREAALQLLPEDRREALRAALEDGADPGELPDEIAAVHQLLTHDDPAGTAEILERVPDAARWLLARFSPAAQADRIRDPVVALHSVDDPAVPYGEALRLQRGVPGTRLVSVALFDHVDLTDHSARGLMRMAPDLWRSWRFASWVLSAQEPWVPYGR